MKKFKLIVCGLLASFLMWGQPTDQIQKLLASDGIEDDHFGVSVGISGDVAVIGTYRNQFSGEIYGSAYIFSYSSGVWVQLAKLTASDASAGDTFGTNVSISGDVVVVSARDDDDGEEDSGSAYIFVKPAGGWVDMTETAKLTASDASKDDSFGRSVCISNNVVIVGANHDDDAGTSSGSAYIFVKPAGGWVSMSETAKLTASDAANSDNFGSEVSISGDVALVGAQFDDDDGDKSGSAYIFVKPDGGWASMTETAKLTASDAYYNDVFGHTVAISEDVAVVGAKFDDDNGPNTGSAYVFVKPAGGWTDMTETAKLKPSDGTIRRIFSYSIDISDDKVIAGAGGIDENGRRTGYAYVFVKPAGGWVDMTETNVLVPADRAYNAFFGASVSISGDLAICGAYADDENGTSTGSAYVFGPSPCNDFTVRLRDSNIFPLAGGSLDYKESGGVWVSAFEISDGLFCIDTDAPTVKLRMTYGPQIQIVSGVSTASSYNFQTELVTAELRNFDGALGKDGWLVEYTSNGWHTFGTTGDDGKGIVTLQMLPNSYTFRISSNGQKNLIHQYLVGTDGTTVTFQLVKANIWLNHADGSPGINEADVFWKNSSSSWTYLGKTGYKQNGDPGTVGVTRALLLPDTYKIRMEYLGGRETKANLELTDDVNNIVFDSYLVTVTLSDGTCINLTDGGEVNHGVVSWNTFGTTGDDGTGVVSMELIHDSRLYDFEMEYDGLYEKKTGFDASTSPTIEFCEDELNPKNSLIEDDEKEFLLTSFPNPFNTNTTIAFSLKETTHINISVFDQTGRLIEVLQEGIQTEGKQKISWDASSLNKGVYFVRLSSEGKVVHQTIVKM